MIIVDVETTGLNPQKHSIVSIGGIEFHNSKNQLYQECRIWEGAEIDREALVINGFTEESVKNINKQTLEETIKQFATWAQTKTGIIAGANPEFDREFLKASFKRYNIPWNYNVITLDIRAIWYAHSLKSKHPLKMRNGKIIVNFDAVLAYVGLPSEPKPHNALTGAKLEAEAFSRLIYGRQLLPEYVEFRIPEYVFTFTPVEK